MADQQHKTCSIATLRKLEQSCRLHMLEHEANASLCARQLLASGNPLLRGFLAFRLLLAPSWVRVRKLAYATVAVGGVAAVGMLALWWRLSSGPIDLDLATPWLTAAIEDNFGSGHQVEVGGTQLERDARGRTALRIRDIVVRDADGAVVASAPKAEVGVSGTGLLTGRVRAQRLSLVGAEMQVRIEPDSKVTIFAGANKRPFVTASVAPAVTGSTPPAAHRSAGLVPLAQPLNADRSPAPSTSSRNTIPDFAALLAWIDSLGVAGLDGRDLGEVGFKDGNLTVDDQRNGKQWTFRNVNLSLTRASGGSVALTVSSEADERPWLLRAALKPGDGGHRTIDIETEKLPARDLMLAMRIGDGQYEPDMPISARIRADLGPDGMPQMIVGRVLLESGTIIDTDDPLGSIAIDRAEFRLDWDPIRQALVAPFQIVSGGNRFTLNAQLDAPHEAGGAWGMTITGGTVVLASAAGEAVDPLILNRFLLRLRIDPEKQRAEIEHGEIGNMDVGLAIKGHLDFGGSEPRLDIGIGGSRMSVDAMKRLWPTVVNPKLRAWIEENLISGTVEHIAIAANAQLIAFKSSGPPLPDEGVSIEIVGSGVELRPVYGLPPIRDADVRVSMTGRTATVRLARGNVEVSPGRRLAITGGTFEVPDTYVDAPPAKVRFRLDGSVPAAAELLSLERLRDFAGAPVEPGTSRGNFAAQVALGLPIKRDLAPGSAQYTIAMDITNFSAERLVMGQKVEAGALKVAANNYGYNIRGDVKINGIPANLDYRKPRGEADADVRLQATLDENARAKLGFDVAGYLSGPIPVKISGKVPTLEGEGRYTVEADLTQSRVDKLLPGWTKPAGRTARATFTLVSRSQSTRFDDLLIEAPGTSVKGTVEIDGSGQITSANIPVFQLSDGDKANVKAERGSDGTLRVVMRGEVYDGRGFVKSSLSGGSGDQAKQQIKDIDLDIKLGTVVGFHGETLRGVELRMSRRGGAVKTFSLNAKLGRDTAITGDMRGRPGGRSVIYVESADAGSFFRFSDTYPKIFGGQMWIAMDPPTGDPMAPQEGILNVRDFAVRGEPSLERVAAGAADAPGTPAAQRQGVDFTRMRVEFTRSHGRFAIRDAIVSGPMIGATAEGYIDYLKEEVRMRGTFVPLYGLNNMFGQIPIFGLFLGGGDKEGLLGLTYEVVGPPSAPVLRVNPVSVVAPGLLRKFFEFPSSNRTQSYADPTR